MIVPHTARYLYVSKKSYDFIECENIKVFPIDAIAIIKKNKWSLRTYSDLATEKAVLDSLQQIIHNQTVQYEYMQKPDKKIVSEPDLLAEALEKVSMKEIRIKDAYENGIDTIEEYKANKIRLQKEREQLLSELDRLIEQPDEDKKPDMQEVLKRITNVYDLLIDQNIDNDTKGNALRRIVKQITFDRKNNEFHFYYYA